MVEQKIFLPHQKFEKLLEKFKLSHRFILEVISLARLASLAANLGPRYARFCLISLHLLFKCITQLSAYDRPAAGEKFLESTNR